MTPRTIDGIDWDGWQPTDRATLLFVVKEDRILLIRKKRGLGAGKVNGPGGRVEPGESLQACAVREVQEELGITPLAPELVGEHNFQFTDGYGLHVHVFVSRDFTGEPVETDEAIPLWVSLDEIPYDEMWEDDRLWLPHLLNRQPFVGWYVFEGDSMLDHRLSLRQPAASAASTPVPLVGLLLCLCLWMGCAPAEEPGDLPPEPVERQVLHEMFTGSTCGPCLSADARLVEIFEANPGRHNLISYQLGGDPYNTGEATSRIVDYGSEVESGYAIPYLYVDGVTGLHPNLAHEGEEEQGYLQSDFDAAAAVPTWLEIEVTHAQTDQTIDWSVRLDSGADIPSDDLVLHVVIIEAVTYLNVGTNGQTEFHHVMKKMLPDDHGTAIDPLVQGGEVQLDGSYTFVGDYDDSTGFSNPVDHSSAHTVEEFEDLSVIAFVQDAVSRQVHQSAWSGQE